MSTVPTNKTRSQRSKPRKQKADTPGRAAGSHAVALPSCSRLWTTKEVSEFLGVPVATLHQWRHAGTGPDAFRVGKHLRYDPDGVRQWLVDECRREVTD
jgi:predicted DNA-binding transcriptional regulator AlpA